MLRGIPTIGTKAWEMECRDPDSTKIVLLVQGELVDETMTTRTHGLPISIFFHAKGGTAIEQVIMLPRLPTPTADKYMIPGLIAPGTSIAGTIGEKGGATECQPTVTTMLPPPAAHGMIVLRSAMTEEVGMKMTLMTFNIDLGEMNTSMIAAG